MSAPILAVEGLTSGYGRIQVLRGVDFAINRREITGILGRNGVGKTTLMKTLNRLLTPTGGQIRINGEDISRRPTHDNPALGLGYVPQGRGLFPALTVRENLLVGLSATGAPLKALEEALELFPAIKAKLDQRAGGLSGGQQQLVALARALTLKPGILLLDEPSEGIQPSILQEIAATLKRLRNGAGLSILVVEQNLDFALGLMDRAFIMDGGEIRRELTHEDLGDIRLVERQIVSAEHA
jgi:ABC-type branched-subunit amino acid transport system ATPase component